MAHGDMQKPNNIPGLFHFFGVYLPTVDSKADRPFVPSQMRVFPLTHLLRHAAFCVILVGAGAVLIFLYCGGNHFSPSNVCSLSRACVRVLWCTLRGTVISAVARK